MWVTLDSLLYCFSGKNCMQFLHIYSQLTQRNNQGSRIVKDSKAAAVLSLSDFFIYLGTGEIQSASRVAASVIHEAKCSILPFVLSCSFDE